MYAKMGKLQNWGRFARLLRKQITCADLSAVTNGVTEQNLMQYQALSDVKNHTDAGYIEGKFNLLY